MLSFCARTRSALAAFGLAVLSGCASIPYAALEGPPPQIEQPADASPGRAALNARVYDQTVDYVERLFYRADFGGVDFPAEAEAARPLALAQPDADSFYADLSTLLKGLDDDHTQVLSPAQRQLAWAAEQGRARPGVGLVLLPIGDERWVQSVRPDGPAGRAGVLPGWKLISVAGHPVLTAPAAADGRTDEFVFIDDEGRSRTVSLTSTVLEPRPPFESRILDDGVAYIRFENFEQGQLEQFAAAIEAMAGAPPPGLILDLRQNGGGRLDIMAKVLTRFFNDKQGFVVLHHRFRKQRVNVLPAPNPYLGPLAILIGPGSASASELLAAGLREKDRAVLVGLRTRGAVTGTRDIDLADGGLLRVGMLVMTTHGGITLEKVGVAPDIEVPISWAAVREGRDLPLEAAQRALREQDRMGSAASRPDAP